MSIVHTPEDTTNDSTDLDAIASLLLEEVGEVNAGRKDKRRQDVPPTDDEVAFDLFANELMSLLSVIQDQRMARSMEAALRIDQLLSGCNEGKRCLGLLQSHLGGFLSRGSRIECRSVECHRSPAWASSPPMNLLKMLIAYQRLTSNRPATLPAMPITPPVSHSLECRKGF
ncbi:hypothetical protein JB92DRAFT_2903023 [Gautieria morchelliformis]|nr:hypothetical protein JB92DRAFT_2903023 [Gautieria morchelliformis]